MAKTTPKADGPLAGMGQITLVLQGGGALGAYQAGVYEALHEAGIEPDWIIGTSIGAINAGIIAGNRPEDRLDRLKEFWARVRHPASVTAVPRWHICRDECDYFGSAGFLCAQPDGIHGPQDAARP
jgi:NTE family protein